MTDNQQNQDEKQVSERETIWNWVDVLLMTLFCVVILVLGFSAFNLLLGDPTQLITSQDQPSLLFNAGIAALEAVALLGSVSILGLRRRNYNWSAVGFRTPSTTWWWYAVLIAIVFIPLMGLIAMLIQLALGRPVENPQLEFLLPEDYSWLGAVAMLALGGIAVPIAEEVFFRGVLYRWLRDRWGVWVGVVLSALAFGALHGEISVAGATFVMGLVLAWTYERSKSLWPPVLIHILNNSLKLLALYALIATGIEVPGLQ